MSRGDGFVRLPSSYRFATAPPAAATIGRIRQLQMSCAWTVVFEGHAFPVDLRWPLSQWVQSLGGVATDVAVLATSQGVTDGPGGFVDLVSAWLTRAAPYGCCGQRIAPPSCCGPSSPATRRRWRAGQMSPG